MAYWVRQDLGLSQYCETMLKEAESSVNSGDENLS